MFDNWLNRLTKLATLIPIVSMVIGAMIIHNYLNTIGFNDLFPDIILTSAVLALILIYIVIITTCIYIIPFLLTIAQSCFKLFYCKVDTFIENQF